MKDSSPEDIIEFWFGFKSDIRAIIAEKSMLWWSKNENVDAAKACEINSLTVNFSTLATGYPTWSAREKRRFFW